MKKSIKFLPLLATGLLAVGCQDYDAGFTEADIKTKQYADKFVQEFGQVDPNQDWSMATLVEANVNLPELQGTAKMNIMTGDPRLSSTRLLAQIMLQDGKGQIQFDAIKGNNNVFVTVEQDGQYKVFGQYNISEGMLNIGDAPVLTGMTRTFSATDNCPATVGSTKTNLFTNIPSTYTKYHYGDKYYTLEELRAWGEEHKDEMSLTSHAPFNNDCVISGTYDFASATLNNEKVITATNGGYIYNGTFYTEAELRAWAQSQYAAGNVTADNYSTATPFGSDCVKTEGYDYSNPQINPEKVTPVERPFYRFQMNGQWIIWYSLDEIIEWSKQNESGSWNQWTQQSNVLTGVTWDSENNCPDYSNAQPNQYMQYYDTSYYLYEGNYYTMEGLISLVQNNSSWMKNNGPFTNVYSAGGLDFSAATIDNTKVTTVAAGSYIYDGQVFASESALQTYTVDNNLDNFGPYENCCQGTHLDFTNATINETQAPLEHEPLNIDLKYLKDVQHDPAAPWTCAEGYSLFGTGGFFEEQLYYWGQGDKASDKTLTYGPDAETRKEVIKQIESGFKIKTEGGAINMPYIYSATGKYDQLGYVFYKDGEDPLAQPHYVLIENAMPKNNIHKGTADGPTWGGTEMYYQFMKSYDDYAKYSTESPEKMQEFIDFANTKVYGTNYPVVYIDPKTGKGTYDIPAGLNMVFFISVVGSESDLTAHTGYETGNFNYSIPELNQRIGNNYTNTQSPTYSEMQDKGRVKATAWKSGDKVFLGFEDGGGDEDLNDIVFLVSGNFSTQEIINLQPIKWHINKNKSHDTTDNDLFDIYNLKPGESYSNPANEPVNGDLTFLGWSTTPDNSSNDLTKTITNATVPATGKCYFAIWSEPEVEDPVTIKWHKNYSGSHDTSDADLFLTQTVEKDAAYTKPASTPEPPTGMTFIGWATEPDADVTDVLTNDELSNLKATEDKCYFAIYAVIPDEPSDDPEPMTWIFACEDLGGTFDYDFNDVVWEVRNNGGQLQARVLAAGGTLDFTIAYNGEGFFTKSTKFGANRVSEVMIQLDVTDADWINVSTVGSDWSITTQNSSQFTVSVVNDGEGNSKIIDRPTGSAPYDKSAELIPEILLVPGDWAWPLESHSIKVAYKDFINWAYNAENPDWINPTPGEVVTR